MSVAVAQAMRYAGCPNRRSLGVREVPEARKARSRRLRKQRTEKGKEEETQAVGAGAGASVQATLTAGRLVAGSGDGGGGGSAEGSASGEVGGLGGVRHRAAVAEARRHLGGGGKRGWAE